MLNFTKFRKLLGPIHRGPIKINHLNHFLPISTTLLHFLFVWGVIKQAQLKSLLFLTNAHPPLHIPYPVNGSTIQTGSHN